MLYYIDKMDTSTWRKCYSSTRKRSYYYNIRNGISVWTIEDTLKQTNNEIKQDKLNVSQPDTKSKPENAKPKIKKKRLEAIPKKVELKEKKFESKEKKTEPKETTSKNETKAKRKNIEMLLNNDSESEEPMDVDNIIENVKYHKRF